ncbi:hypothetical protein FNV43_RR26504 [Rhamnella rubrinervis]|uniref:Uncharacterized protein n=1 Tax=Rhamnella rubrinervis TaxID=2594499 RepID=A0A8K0DMQ0_9ROSA|nr:hypothetical protein FNV43_RR26504 [Rhamnella rubrinervis]
MMRPRKEGQDTPAKFTASASWRGASCYIWDTLAKCLGDELVRVPLLYTGYPAKFCEAKLVEGASYYIRDTRRRVCGVVELVGCLILYTGYPPTSAIGECLGRYWPGEVSVYNENTADDWPMPGIFGEVSIYKRAPTDHGVAGALARISRI